MFILNRGSEWAWQILIDDNIDDSNVILHGMDYADSIDKVLVWRKYVIMHLMNNFHPPICYGLSKKRNAQDLMVYIQVTISIHGVCGRDKADLHSAG
jgi:hypothetical protein